VANARLAALSKRARRLRATIAFIDESGLLLSPLVRRTLAPKGQTPRLVVRGHREKVSILGALTLSPQRGRRGLYFQTLAKHSFHGGHVARFLRHLLRHLRGRVLVVWDNWTGHKGPDVRRVLADHPRLTLESLPPYAPQLNPVEHLWSHLKWSALCNFAPANAAALNAAIVPKLTAAKSDKRLMASFWNGARLKTNQWRC
jgi:putative transposase